MSHMIDETTGRPAIAYVGDTPWHGLGHRLESDQPIEVWAEKAGLSHDVYRAPVVFDRNFPQTQKASENRWTPEMNDMNDRDVLFRSDTGAPLSVVGKGYKVVQPREVLDFFAKLAEIGGFELETAGALSGGRRIWGLAKVNDGAPVVGHDVVRPYILLATSYDGTLATTGKFTGIRVVCNNTITMAVGGMMQAKLEHDTEGLPVSSLVRIPHSTAFDPDAVRLQLGVVKDVFERWLIDASLMAQTKLADDEFDNFLVQLLEPMQPKTVHGKPPKPVNEGKPFARIKSIWQSEMIGGDMAGPNNRWRALNAVTQFVDYERGRSADTRLSGAWFGVGDTIKDRAFDLLTKTVEFEPA